MELQEIWEPDPQLPVDSLMESQGYGYSDAKPPNEGLIEIQSTLLDYTQRLSPIELREHWLPDATLLHYHLPASGHSPLPEKPHLRYSTTHSTAESCVGSSDPVATAGVCRTDDQDEHTGSVVEGMVAPTVDADALKEVVGKTEKRASRTTTEGKAQGPGSRIIVMQMYYGIASRH